MLALFICLISASPADDEDIRKVLEFQYQQKLTETLRENESLKAEVARLRANQFMACDLSTDKPEMLKIDGKLRQSHGQLDEQNLYRRGLKEIQVEQWDDAVLTMESFVQQYPKSSLADRALFWIAQVYLQKNEVGLARAELERLIQLYPKGDRAKFAEDRLQSLLASEEKGKSK